MPDYRRFLGELTASGVSDIRCDEPMSAHTSWRIGGPADVFVEPQSAEQLRAVLVATDRLALPVVVIGHGTNLLFDDAGVRGVVVRIGSGMSRVTIDDCCIQAESGVWVPGLARTAGKAGLAGLEHTVGIPGTLGGLVVMNGGSRRQNIGACVQRVQVLDRRGRSRYYSRAECQFSYRSSLLQDSYLIVGRVELVCMKEDPRAIRQEMLRILKDRRHKFPGKQPNCGSVFVSNPVMHERFGTPGQVIEQAGLKGLRIGDAQVSSRHANFIVNLGRARSSDVRRLICRIRETVFQRTGLWLTCEVRYVHPDGDVVSASDASASPAGPHWDVPLSLQG